MNPADTGSGSAVDRLPALPEFEVDRYGTRVDLRGDHWTLPDLVDSYSVNWSDWPHGEVKQSFKLWIAHSLRKHSPRETSNQFVEMHYALRNGGYPTRLEEMDHDWWKALRHNLRAGDVEYRLHRLRAAFLWMADSGFPGVDDETAFAIEHWTIPGNVKGEAVRSRDQDHGPLSEEELKWLIQAVHRRAEVTAPRVATMLCLDFGPNPKNLALCEERDLHVFMDPKSGANSYQLDVPRIKKRLSYRQTKRRKLSRETGAAVAALIKRNRQNHGGNVDPNRPILCREPCTERRSVEARFRFHYSSAEVSKMIQLYGDECGLCVPGPQPKPFRISARRLRYTFATRLAVQGASPAQLASALDHTDLQHVQVYIEAAGRMAENLTAVVGPQVEGTINKFLGRIIPGPKQGIPNDPAAHIWARVSGNMLGGIGTCGSGSVCRRAPPFSCYNCALFQAWETADHVGFLSKLKEARADPYVERVGSGGLALIDDLIQSVEFVASKSKSAQQSLS